MLLEELPPEKFFSHLIEYVDENRPVFRMIFSPHNTGELRHKFINMTEGVFRLVQTEKNPVALKDIRLDYLSSFWSSGCIAIYEKWVQSNFSQSKDFIIRTIAELDKNMEKFIASQL